MERSVVNGVGAPNILAIDDVHLTAPREAQDRLTRFYCQLVGLNQMGSEWAGEPGEVTFHGAHRSGPRLVVRLHPDRPPAWLKRDVLIQVASLSESARLMSEQRIEFETTQGLTSFDLRIAVWDPGGNRVELVSSHSL